MLIQQNVVLDMNFTWYTLDLYYSLRITEYLSVFSCYHLFYYTMEEFIK